MQTLKSKSAGRRSVLGRDGNDTRVKATFPPSILRPSEARQVYIAS